jgi:anti-sigma factor RsiW
MDCRKAQRLAQHLAEGRLGDLPARELQRHLTECTDCRVAQQRLARLQQLLALKRHEHPGAHYFQGFLPEFHRRLAEATAPQPTWWGRALETLHVQNTLTLRHGYAQAFGVLLAVGMILRGLLSLDLSGPTSSTELDLRSARLLSADTVPQSQPRKITFLLPRSPEPAPPAGGALIVPAVAHSEPNPPRYVLDRISLSPPSYEVASIQF